MVYMVYWGHYLLGAARGVRYAALRQKKSANEGSEGTGSTFRGLRKSK